MVRELHPWRNPSPFYFVRLNRDDLIEVSLMNGFFDFCLANPPSGLISIELFPVPFVLLSPPPKRVGLWLLIVTRHRNSFCTGNGIVGERTERRRAAERGRSAGDGLARTEERKPVPPVQVLRGAADVVEKRQLPAQGQRGKAHGRREQTEGNVAGAARRLEFSVGRTRMIQRAWRRNQINCTAIVLYCILWRTAEIFFFFCFFTFWLCVAAVWV